MNWPVFTHQVECSLLVWTDFALVFNVGSCWSDRAGGNLKGLVRERQMRRQARVWSERVSGNS
jgi:hypothetical protein